MVRACWLPENARRSKISCAANHPLSEIAISVRDLHKSYGDFEAVRGIDFEVQRRRSVRSARPERGGEDHDTRNSGGSTPALERHGFRSRLRPRLRVKRIKDRIGVCLQHTNLPDKMKVCEALELFAAFYTRNADRDKLLQRLQLWDKKDALYKSLSGGQKQRVALALALVNEPTLFFLDEPTTGLDPQVRHEIHGIIQELKKDRRSILITTHYIEEAERLCDRVAIIDAGKIIESGAPREIQQRVLGHTAVEITTDHVMPVEKLPESLRAEKYSIRDDGRTLSMQSDSPAALIVELVGGSANAICACSIST